MEKPILPLTMARINRDLVLVSIEGGWGLRRRLSDMGLAEGMKFRVLHIHRPGPCIVLAGNTRLVLGYGMAHRIMVKEA